jgi:pilus assembly protein CpaF
MTAFRGGERHNGGPSRMTTLASNLTGATDTAPLVPRPLGEIFPQRTDANRARQMQETWVAFFSEMDGAVRGVLESGRSPPEIAYAIGETVHNYFRTRGVTLTSYELRRLVIEILDMHTRGHKTATPTAEPAPPPEPTQQELFYGGASSNGSTTTLVAFADERAADQRAQPEAPWVGDAPEVALHAVPDAAFEAPPSNLVSLPVRELGQPAQGTVAPIVAPPMAPIVAPPVAARSWQTRPAETLPEAATARPAAPPPVTPARPAPAQRQPVAAEAPAPAMAMAANGSESLLPSVVAELRTRPPLSRGQAASRDEILRAIDAGIGEILQRRGEQLRPDARQRLGHLAFSEMYGVGIIDRLWADRSVTALLVNGPRAVFVERGGSLEPASETFRDEAHLVEVANRLARRAAAGRSSVGLADFQLRDGLGTVVFPPAAPGGPVIVVRRTESGAATFDRLVAVGMLSQSMADLLRVATRSKLNVLVSGPPGVGKTGLLAAMARDLGGSARIVSVAREREFRWNGPTMVELVAQNGGGEAGYSALVAVGARLRPDLLILDSVRAEDTPTVLERLALADRGIAASVGHAATSTTLEPSVDLIARVERGRDGVGRVTALQDSAGTTLFAWHDGQFVRRDGEPAFAAAIRVAGFSEALHTILR